MNFKISKLAGIKFAKSSGDNNQIHLNEKVGYNSIFGETVCHGCNVFIKAIKLISRKYKKLNSHNSYEIKFYKHFSYNKNIFIKKRSNTKFELKQNNFKSAEIFVKKNICKTKKLFKILKNINFLECQQLIVKIRWLNLITILLNTCLLVEQMKKLN